MSGKDLAFRDWSLHQRAWRGCCKPGRSEEKSEAVHLCTQRSATGLVCYSHETAISSPNSRAAMRSVPIPCSMIELKKWSFMIHYYDPNYQSKNQIESMGCKRRIISRSYCRHPCQAHLLTTLMSLSGSWWGTAPSRTELSLCFSLF